LASNAFNLARHGVPALEALGRMSLTTVGRRIKHGMLSDAIAAIDSLELT
jgi:hypothetical protein